MGVLGDILFRTASLWDNLAGNITTTKKFLTQTGTGAVSAAPGWNTIVAGDLPNTTVTPGSYTATNLTVDAQGRLTAAANGSSGGGNVTTSATLTSGKTIVGNGTTDITVSALTATVVKSSSGTASAASAGTDYVAPGAITTSGLTQATARLLGRTTAATGAVEEITVGTGLSLSAGSLTSTASGGTVTTTGSPANGNLTKFTGATSISNADLTGDVTTSGTVGTTIANSAVTLAKIANAAANSKLLGSGASGSGSAYVELTLGTNLTMSGTTLNAAAGTSGALTQLSQIVTAASQSTVDFTSISGSYTTIKIIYVTQDTQAGTSSTSLRVRLNNDSTSGNYTATSRSGSSNGSAVVNTLAASSGGVTVGLNPQAGNTNIAATGEVTIPSYAGTTWHKRIMASTAVDDGTSNGSLFDAEARWKSTAAVTRVTFTTDGTAFTNGSVFTLYGVS